MNCTEAYRETDITQSFSAGSLTALDLSLVPRPFQKLEAGTPGNEANLALGLESTVLFPDQGERSGTTLHVPAGITIYQLD